MARKLQHWQYSFPSFSNNWGVFFPRATGKRQIIPSSTLWSLCVCWEYISTLRNTLAYSLYFIRGFSSFCANWHLFAPVQSVQRWFVCRFRLVHTRVESKVGAYSLLLLQFMFSRVIVNSEWIAIITQTCSIPFLELNYCCLDVVTIYSIKGWLWQSRQGEHWL